MADTIDGYAGYRAAAELYAGWGLSPARTRIARLAGIPPVRTTPRIKTVLIRPEGPERRGDRLSHVVS